MRSAARTCLSSILKVVNSTMGIVGIAMILYGLWMVSVWQRDMERSSFDFDSTSPWFIYSFLSIGVTLCVITCIGHISADSSNGFCLSCYTVIIFALLLLETAAAADIFLNSNWEKDLPEDPTGRFHDFKEFVQSNMDVFQWIVMLFVSAQGFSILLAMVLRSFGPTNRSNYDSDDEYLPARLPLINNQIPPAYVVGEPRFASKNNDTWHTNK